MNLLKETGKRNHWFKRHWSHSRCCQNWICWCSRNGPCGSWYPDKAVERQLPCQCKAIAWCQPPIQMLHRHNMKRLKMWFNLFVFDYQSIFKWTYRIRWGKLWRQTIRFQSLNNPWWNPPSNKRLPTWRNIQIITWSPNHMTTFDSQRFDWSESKSHHCYLLDILV